MEKSSEGFILSNNIRKAVYLEIASGETSLDKIAKRHRIIPTLVNTAITEIVEEGLIKKTRKGYVLTDQGTKILTKIKSHETL